jgi:hypothetical protein
MKFPARVEPPEPMRGPEVPPEIVAALGGGTRPPVTRGYVLTHAAELTTRAPRCACGRVP